MSSAGELDGRVVLLTGASGGIGSVTARALGARGATVIAHYGGNRNGAEAAVADVPAHRRLLLHADMREAGSARALCASSTTDALVRSRTRIAARAAAVMTPIG